MRLFGRTSAIGRQQLVARTVVSLDPPFQIAAGIIAYQLLTGRLPFDDEESEEMSRAFMSQHTVDRKEAFRATLSAPLDFAKPPWDVLSPAARDFVQSMLQREPSARPIATQLLQHKWLVSRHADQGGNLHHDVQGGAVNDTLVQRLQRYGTYGKLKQAALRAVASRIRSDSEFVQDLKGGFETLDPNKTGSIPYETVADMLSNGACDDSGCRKIYDLSAVETQQLLAQFHVGEAACLLCSCLWCQGLETPLSLVFLT